MKVDLDYLEPIILLLILIALVVGCIFCVYQSIQMYTKHHDEWNTKVNNCVMDNNYRKDCKLILYKHQTARTHNCGGGTTYMPIYMGR